MLSAKTDYKPVKGQCRLINVFSGTTLLSQQKGMMNKALETTETSA